MSFSSISRRKLLAAIAAGGGVSRLAPFLPRAVHAASVPKRILTVFSPMGYLEPSFWPTGTGTNYTLGETMTALQPWKSKLLYLDGLAMYGAQWFFSNPDNEHASGGNMVFTGSKMNPLAGGPSIEQAVADFQYAQAKTAFRSLALGVNSGTPSQHTAIFYSKAQTPVTAQTNAQTTFNQLFANFTGPTAPPSTGTGGSGGTLPKPPVDTSASDRLQRQKQSVVDLVKDELARVRKLAGTEDRERMDAHLEGINSLENRIKLLAMNTPPINSVPTTPSAPSGPIATPGSAGAGCAKPNLTGSGLTGSIHSQMDLITAAFACDMTRHISLQLGICDGGIDAIDGVNQHGTTHSYGDTKAAPPHVENHKRYDRWYADRWAYLLGKMDAIKEGNGTLLDNTLIVFGSDTTTNHSAFGLGPHNHIRFPLWMAGGGNFAFKTGQAIQLPHSATDPGSPALVARWVTHQRLLTSIGQAFGMNIDTFGSNDPGKGPVTQLTRV